jgi:nucleoside-diphosphate kinase
MTERTLVLLKPDALERRLAGEIIRRIEDRGFSIVAMDMRQMSVEFATKHYEEHVGREYFEPLIAFMTSGPIVAMVIEGPEVIQAWRTMQGATNPFDAAPGTIRADYATSNRLNLTHGSDSAESARREIALFFPNLA